MINTQIRQFRNSIIELTNASPLPIEVKRLVFVEVKQAIDSQADNVIATEQKKEEESKEVNPDEQDSDVS